jgi:putative ABC transport system permease protein
MRDSFRALPGVVRVEGLRMAPVRLHAGHLNREVALTGLGGGEQLRRALDVKLRPVEMPPAGIVLTTALAERLQVHRGQSIWVELLQGDKRLRPVKVSRLLDEPVGYGAYMHESALARLLGEAPTVDSVLLQVDAGQTTPLFARFKATPRASGATRTETMMRNFRELVRQSLVINLIFLGAFAGAITAAIVYNDARIALAERSRELATLRVIGFTRGEIARVLFGELAAVMTLGLPLGGLIGWTVALIVIPVFGNDMMRLPVVPRPSSFAIAASMVIIAGLLSAVTVRRQLNRLDLLAVLKAHD